MATPTKLAAEKCIDDGRFCYPPDLKEKVDAYRRARMDLLCRQTRYRQSVSQE